MRSSSVSTAPQRTPWWPSCAPSFPICARTAITGVNRRNGCCPPRNLRNPSSNPCPGGAGCARQGDPLDRVRIPNLSVMPRVQASCSAKWRRTRARARKAIPKPAVTPSYRRLLTRRPSSSRWQMLADLKPDEFEAKVDRAKRKAVSALNGTAREVIREAERAKYAHLKQVGGTVSDLLT